MKETNNENVLRYDKLIYFHIINVKLMHPERKKTKNYRSITGVNILELCTIDYSTQS